MERAGEGCRDLLQPKARLTENTDRLWHHVWAGAADPVRPLYRESSTYIRANTLLYNVPPLSPGS